jgi:hypothetical protein
MWWVRTPHLGAQRPGQELGNARLGRFWLATATGGAEKARSQQGIEADSGPRAIASAEGQSEVEMRRLRQTLEAFR